MTNPEIAIVMLCLFIVLVLLGFPIAFTLLAMVIGFGYYAITLRARPALLICSITIFSIC